MSHLPLAALLAALFLSPQTVSAYSPKEGNISATFGWVLHRTNFQTSHTGASAPYQGDLALLLTGDVNDRAAIEIAAYHMNKQFFRDLGSQYVGEETEQIEITMGYRHWIAPSFSVAVAFSSAYTLGYVRQIHNDFAPLPAIDTSAQDKVEYAGHFSAQADLYTFERWTASVNALYSLSFTGKPNEKADHYGIVIGLRYFIQEKQSEKPRSRN